MASQNSARQSKERGEEASHTYEKEQIRSSTTDTHAQLEEGTTNTPSGTVERDFEGGFGGQEDLEDRYATTSGEH